jgi:N-acetylglucosaminyl-diphospho-decaprenol L-rhamnosyltransferase
MAGGSVVVVAHNSSGCVEACLRALCAESGWEILLIDNASSDSTRELAAIFAGRVRVIANRENRGFAAAVNQGVQLASGAVIAVLNPDVVPEPGALDRLANLLADPETAAAGGMLLDAEGRPQRGFMVRRFPTVSSSLCELLLVNRLWPSNFWNSRYRCLQLDYSRLQEVEQPAGAALAFRRDAWKRAGGLDESFYPLWFEDVDFCFRLRRLGFRILYCPEAVFHHGGAHSVSRLTFRDRQAHWYANLLRYFRKHHGVMGVAILRIGIAAGMLCRSLGVLAVGVPGLGRGEALRAYASVLWRFAIRGDSAATLPPLPGSSHAGR